MRRVEAMLETTSEGLNFALWYLKQRSLVTSDDKSNLLITVEGMDYLETNPPTPETVMPLVRAVGLAPKTRSAPAASQPNAASGDLNVKRIREALARV